MQEGIDMELWNYALILIFAIVGFTGYKIGISKGRKREKLRVEYLIRQALNIRMSGTVRWIYNAVMDGKDKLMDEDKFFGGRPTPSEKVFREMAAVQPEKLVEWIGEGTFKNGLLTRAAEALGQSDKPDVVVPCLMRLLEHEASVVREGAVYGAENFLNIPEVRHKIEEMAAEESSQGVRTAAAEALDI
jgi:hypothetical protein